MKIVQANAFYYRKGGAEMYMLDLSDWLRSQGYEVIPFAMQHEKNSPTPFTSYFPRFVETERVSFGLGALRTVARMTYGLDTRESMRRLLGDTAPDLVHIHNIYTQLSPSLLDACRSHGVPVVMTVHDHHLVSPQYNIPALGCGVDVSSWGFWKTVSSRFLKNSFAASFAQTTVFRLHRYLKIYERGVDLFLCPSEYMRQQLLSAGFSPDRVRTVHTGIDATAIEPRYDHDGYILSAGRLSEEKGIALQIELARRLPDLRFKIAGTGPQEAELHQLSQDLPNVEFVGYQTGEALHRLYQGAMMVLIPSRVRETFPLTTLDAMARGTPVVGSNVGGMPEVVQDRVTGMLAPPDDLSAWVEAVMRLAYDETTRLTMARAARLSMETDFHIKRHHAGVMAAYEEILRKKHNV